MPSAPEVRDKNDSDHIADFVAACNKTRKTGGNLEAFLNGGDHRVNVPGA